MTPRDISSTCNTKKDGRSGGNASGSSISCISDWLQFRLQDASLLLKLLPFTRDGDNVYISVVDSGLGLYAEQVEEINHSIQKTVIKENSHIGLSNVNQRIKLSFGEAYGVTLSSQIGFGTTVTLKFPYMT